MTTIEHFKANPGLHHQHLMGWALSEFGKTIWRLTISRILAAPPPTSVNMDAMRLRRHCYPDMEQLLLEFVALNDDSCALSDLVYWQKANEFISPNKVSLSWVQKLKRRYNIRLRASHGEAGSVNTAQLEQHRAELQELIEQYSPDDVYNLDETGLFFACCQARRLQRGRGSEKLTPLVIDTNKKPHCFNGVND